MAEFLLYIFPVHCYLSIISATSGNDVTCREWLCGVTVTKYGIETCYNCCELVRKEVEKEGQNGGVKEKCKKEKKGERSCRGKT